MADDTMSFASCTTSDSARKSFLAREAFSQAGLTFSDRSHEMAREWINWFATSAETSRRGLTTLAQCSTPLDFAETQTRLLREHIELLIESGQRILDIGVALSKTTAVRAATIRRLSK